MLGWSIGKLQWSKHQLSDLVDECTTRSMTKMLLWWSQLPGYQQETQNHRLAKRFSQTLRNAGASGHAVWAVTRILSSSFVPSSAKWIMLQFSILRDIY